MSYFDVESYSLHPHLGKKDFGVFFRLTSSTQPPPSPLAASQGFLVFFTEEELEMISIASSWTRWVR